MSFGVDGIGVFQGYYMAFTLQIQSNLHQCSLHGVLDKFGCLDPLCFVWLITYSILEVIFSLKNQFSKKAFETR
jgi:hypothetical protein